MVTKIDREITNFGSSYKNSDINEKCNELKYQTWNSSINNMYIITRRFHSLVY